MRYSSGRITGGPGGPDPAADQSDGERMSVRGPCQHSSRVARKRLGSMPSRERLDSRWEASLADRPRHSEPNRA